MHAYCAAEVDILFGVLQIQLIKAIDAARLTAGWDKLLEIQDNWTIEEE